MAAVRKAGAAKKKMANVRRLASRKPSGRTAESTPTGRASSTAMMSDMTPSWSE